MKFKPNLFIIWFFILHIVSSAHGDFTRLDDGPSRECPEGFFSIKGSACLKLFLDAPVTWEEAGKKCKAEGLGMASHLDDIAVDLRKYIHPNIDMIYIVWLGASGDGSTMRWKLQPGYNIGSNSLVEKTSPLWRWQPRRVRINQCLTLRVTENEVMQFPTQPYWAESCTQKAYALCQELPVVEGFDGNVDIPVENDVLLLTSENFIHAINTKDLILVDFYAPWCRRNKHLDPEYEKAAKMLKDENLPLAKVDSFNENNIAKEFQNPSYATMKLFKKGVLVEEYYGPWKADAIVKYMRKQEKYMRRQEEKMRKLEEYMRKHEEKMRKLEESIYTPSWSGVGRNNQLNGQCYPNGKGDYTREQARSPSREVTNPAYDTEKNDMYEETIRAPNELRGSFVDDGRYNYDVAPKRTRQPERPSGHMPPPKDILFSKSRFYFFLKHAGF